MARKILLETGYVFTPASKTIVIPRIIPQERLVLITNVTKNKVIYNFSDASLLATSYAAYGENALTAPITAIATTGSAVTFTAANTFSPGQFVTITGVTPAAFNISATITSATSTTFTVASTVTGTWVSGGLASVSENTTLVLNYNTAGVMAATDKLQITIDQFAEKFEPSEELTDPVGKFRTSQPQALIDTDFEYGQQVSKWENLSLINNRPFAYNFNFNALAVSDVQTGAAGTKTITVSLTTSTASATSAIGNGTIATYTTSGAHNFSVGQLVTITGFVTNYNTTSGQPAVILATPTTTTFTIANSTTANTASSGTGTVTAGVAPAIGSPISVFDTFSPSVPGNYTVEARGSESSFTFSAKGSTSTGWASTTIFDTNKTLVALGTVYKDAALTPASFAYSSNMVTVTMPSTQPHGLHIGNEISVIGSTVASGTAPNGNAYVATVTSPLVFSYYTGTAPSATPAVSPTATTATGAVGSNSIIVASATSIVPGMTVTATGIPAGTLVTYVQGTAITLSQTITTALATTSITFNASIFVRSQAQVKHRAFDGGVFFSTNATSNNVAQVRQTRRYFRYQSGKGIQISSGTILKPTYGIDSLTYSSPFVTVQTKEPHGLQPGYSVSIFGANESGYNGTFAVASVTGLSTFTYVPTTAPTLATASGNYYASVSSWNGASNRLGLFDQQNGVFFEHDGTTLYAVRRSSIFQTAGRVTVTNNSSTVSQTSTNYPTTFTKQLVPGDFIVLRGQSYKVLDIASDTSLTIYPTYRGTTSTNVIVSKTIDTRIPQSAWNIDRVDGTGPSGYNIDLTKMQMFYMDYSWYGAGAVRWGFRGPKGNIVYVHKQANNNQNATAYMRSGNLSGRYESVTTPAATQLTASVGASDTTINVANTSGLYAPTSVSTAATGSNGATTITVTSATGIVPGMFVTGTNIGAGAIVVSVVGLVVTLSVANGGSVSSSITFQTYPGTAVIRGSGASNTWEYINYTGLTSNTLTGVTRAQAGASAVTTTMAVGSNVATVGSTAGLQVGMRAISPYLADGTKIEFIAGTTTLVLSSSPTVANPTIWFPAMGYTTGTLGTTAGTTVTAGQSFTYSATNPTTVEQAFPTFGPSISHWGTSVIMDGRFDDDKSLLFTYGQTTATTLGGTTAVSTTLVQATTGSVVAVAGAATGIVPGQQVTGTGITSGTYVVAVSGTNVYLSQATTATLSGNYAFTGATSKALLSIRIAPSVDNGFAAAFGLRELLNKMQLQTRALDISLVNTSTGNVLVQAYLNGTPYNYGGNTAIATGTASASTTVTLTGNTGTVAVGMLVQGAGVTAGTVVTAVASQSSITVSNSISISSVPLVFLAQGSTSWTNAVRNAANTPNSSLAQIADYAGSNYLVQGGEVTGGFFVSSTGTSDISQVRDLGNAVLGGGTSVSNTGIYPDGPDTLTIVVTNLGSTAAAVLGRIAWTEAQA